MNDKKQLAAMGEHLAEQPMCMTKRIEELEAQVRLMAELLRDLHKHIGTSIPQTVSEYYRGCDLLDRIDAALAGKLPEPVMQEVWQLVPVEPTHDMLHVIIHCDNFDVVEPGMTGKYYRAMLAAAPSPDIEK